MGSFMFYSSESKWLQTHALSKISLLYLTGFRCTHLYPHTVYPASACTVWSWFVPARRRCTVGMVTDHARWSRSLSDNSCTVSDASVYSMRSVPSPGHTHDTSDATPAITMSSLSITYEEYWSINNPCTISGAPYNLSPPHVTGFFVGFYWKNVKIL